MTLTTYNFLWGIVKFILPSYLERRQKKGKEDIHRINERFGVSKNNRPDGTLVWLHGTSVGESVAALALANSMSKNGYGTNKKEFFLFASSAILFEGSNPIASIFLSLKFSNKVPSFEPTSTSLDPLPKYLSLIQ